MSKFKVGDRVKVVSSESKGGKPYFTCGMHEFLDKEFEVEGYVSNTEYTYLRGADGYSWHDDWLELAEEEFNPMPEIRKGDKLVFKHGHKYAVECRRYDVFELEGADSLVCRSEGKQVVFTIDPTLVSEVLDKECATIWEYKEPPKATLELTMEELQDKLGYEFKLVKGGK